MKFLQFIGAKGGEITVEIGTDTGTDIVIWAKASSAVECKVLIARLFQEGDLTDFSGFTKTLM
jgi:hypothetical protein